MTWELIAGNRKRRYKTYRGFLKAWAKALAIYGTVMERRIFDDASELGKP